MRRGEEVSVKWVDRAIRITGKLLHASSIGANFAKLTLPELKERTDVEAWVQRLYERLADYQMASYWRKFWLASSFSLPDERATLGVLLLWLYADDPRSLPNPTQKDAWRLLGVPIEGVISSTDADNVLALPPADEVLTVPDRPRMSIRDTLPQLVDRLWKGTRPLATHLGSPRYDGWAVWAKRVSGQFARIRTALTTYQALPWYKRWWQRIKSWIAQLYPARWRNRWFVDSIVWQERQLACYETLMARKEITELGGDKQFISSPTSGTFTAEIHAALLSALNERYPSLKASKGTTEQAFFQRLLNAYFTLVTEQILSEKGHSILMALYQQLEEANSDCLPEAQHAMQSVFNIAASYPLPSWGSLIKRVDRDRERKRLSGKLEGRGGYLNYLSKLEQEQKARYHHCLDENPDLEELLRIMHKFEHDILNQAKAQVSQFEFKARPQEQFDKLRETIQQKVTPATGFTQLEQVADSLQALVDGKMRELYDFFFQPHSIFLLESFHATASSWLQRKEQKVRDFFAQLLEKQRRRIFHKTTGFPSQFKRQIANFYEMCRTDFSETKFVQARQAMEATYQELSYRKRHLGNLSSKNHAAYHSLETQYEQCQHWMSLIDKRILPLQHDVNRLVEACVIDDNDESPEASLVSCLSRIDFQCEQAGFIPIHPSEHEVARWVKDLSQTIQKKAQNLLRQRYPELWSRVYLYPKRRLSKSSFRPFVNLERRLMVVTPQPISHTTEAVVSGDRNVEDNAGKRRGSGPPVIDIWKTSFSDNLLLINGMVVELLPENATVDEMLAEVKANPLYLEVRWRWDFHGLLHRYYGELAAALEKCISEGKSDEKLKTRFEEITREIKRAAKKLLLEYHPDKYKQKLDKKYQQIPHAEQVNKIYSELHQWIYDDSIDPWSFNINSYLASMLRKISEEGREVELDWLKCACTTYYHGDNYRRIIFEYEYKHFRLRSEESDRRSQVCDEQSRELQQEIERAHEADVKQQEAHAKIWKEFGERLLQGCEDEAKVEALGRMLETHYQGYQWYSTQHRLPSSFVNFFPRPSPATSPTENTTKPTQSSSHSILRMGMG